MAFFDDHDTTTDAPAAPVAAAAVAAPADPAPVASGGFFDSHDAVDPDSFKQKAISDPDFNPEQHAALNPHDADLAFEVRQAKDARPLMDRVKEAFTHKPLEKVEGWGQGVLNFAKGITVGNPVFDDIAAGYYGLTGDPRAKTKQAEAMLAAQHGEESVGNILDKTIGAGGRFMNKLAGGTPANPDSDFEEEPDLSPEAAQAASKRIDRQAFDSDVQSARNQIQLSKGIPLKTGLMATLFPDSARLDPDTLKGEGAPPVNLKHVDEMAAASDPSFFALSQAGNIPGVKQIAGKAVQGVGKALQLPMKAIESAPGALGKAGPVTTAAGGVAAAELAMHNPVAAAKIAAGGLAAKGLQMFGESMEGQGAEAATGVPSELSKRVAKGRFDARRGISGLDLGAEVGRQVGDAPVNALSTALGMAPINLALAQGDPEKFLDQEGSAATFGAALGALHSSRPQLVEALRPHLREQGAQTMDSTSSLGQKSQEYLNSIPEAARNQVLETMGALQGLATQGANGKQGRAQFYVVDGNTYNQEISKLSGDTAAGGGRGFFVDSTGRAIINGDAQGSMNDLAHTVGHEGSHMAQAIIEASGQKGSDIWGGMVNKVRSEVMPNGKPTPDFQEFIDTYNKAFDPSGKTKALDPSSDASINEFLAEHAGRVLAREGNDFALPKTLMDKIESGVGRFAAAAMGIPDKLGQTSQLNRVESRTATNLMRQTLAQVAGLPRSEAPAPAQPASEAAPAAEPQAAAPKAPTAREAVGITEDQVNAMKKREADAAEASVLRGRGRRSVSEATDAKQRADARTSAENEVDRQVDSLVQNLDGQPLEHDLHDALLQNEINDDNGGYKGFIERYGKRAKPQEQDQGSPDRVVEEPLTGEPDPGTFAIHEDERAAIKAQGWNDAEIDAMPVHQIEALSKQEPVKSSASDLSNLSISANGNSEQPPKNLSSVGTEVLPKPSGASVPPVSKARGNASIPETDQVDKARAATKKGTPARDSIDRLDANRGKVVYVRDYNSASKEQPGFGEAVRSKEIAAQSADKRKAGAKGTAQHKPFIPTEIRVNANGEPYVNGFDVDVMLSNLRHVVDFMRDKGIENPLPSDAAIQVALTDYNWNHAHGFDGAGLKRLEQPDSGYNLPKPDQDAQPRPLDSDPDKARRMADMLNMAVNSKPSKVGGEEAMKASALNVENRGFRKSGETNQLRKELEDKGFDSDGQLSKRSAFYGRLSNDLIKGGVTTENPNEGGKSVRPHGFDIDLQKAFQHGKPQFEAVTAGFMPGDSGDSQASSRKSKMDDEGELSKFMPGQPDKVDQDQKLEYLTPDENDHAGNLERAISATKANLSGMGSSVPEERRDSEATRQAIESGDVRELDRDSIQSDIDAGKLGENRGRNEHDVYIDPNSGRVIKITKEAGKFGVAGPGQPGKSLPEYLERLKTVNERLDDDLRFEGVIPDGKGDYKAMISQPFIKGRKATADEIAGYFRSKGYRQFGASSFYHPGTESTMNDAEPVNVIMGDDGNVYPIDVIPKSGLSERRINQIEMLADAYDRMNENKLADEKGSQQAKDILAGIKFMPSEQPHEIDKRTGRPTFFTGNRLTAATAQKASAALGKIYREHDDALQAATRDDSDENVKRLADAIPKTTLEEIGVKVDPLGQFGFSVIPSKRNATLWPAGAGGESVTFTDGDVAYKIFHPQHGALNKQHNVDGVGIQGTVEQLPSGEWSMEFDSGTIASTLEKLHVIARSGGIPSEVVGVTPEGALVVKQPKYTGVKPTASDRVKAFRQANDRAQIAEIDDRSMNTNKIDTMGIDRVAVVDGVPYFFGDMTGGNYTTDNAGNFRVADAVVGKIPEKMLREIPTLRTQINAMKAVENANRDRVAFMPDAQHSGEKLEHSIPEDSLDVVHYSSAEIKGDKIDPKFMKPKAGLQDNYMYRGENKSFFFVKGSEPKKGENVTTGGKSQYEANVSGDRIYDMDKDPLKKWRSLNPAQADSDLQELGYAGFAAKTADGRRFVALYDPTTVKKASFMPGDEDADSFGDGRKTAAFFSKVVGGSDAHRPKADYKPVINLNGDAADFAKERAKYRGEFDQHITTSIPGYDEVQSAVGNALAKSVPEGGHVLDIGASEGSMVKAIAATTGGKVKATGLDPNPDMAASFAKSKVDGADYDVSAFGPKESEGKTAWKEDDGTEVKYFKPGQKFDAIHEGMVFQFLGNNRDAHLDRVKDMLKPGGVAVFEEKFNAPSQEEYDANEATKDKYKGQYYSQEEMATKAKEVLGGSKGMGAMQVGSHEMEAMLSSRFKHVSQFWDSGNFKGYVASDSPEAMQKFHDNLPSTSSNFETTETPRVVHTTGSLPKNTEVASVAHDYTQEEGINPPSSRKWKMDPEVAKEIADHHDAATLDYKDPEVKKSFGSFIDETVKQGKAIIDAGYDIEPWTGRGEPYRSAEDMAADIRDNKHLFFLKTESALGPEGGSEMNENNPMLAKTDIKTGDHVNLANDVFRWVHDFFGHAKDGNDFSPNGEYNAFKEHSGMYSAEAQPALEVETLAYNAWQNFGSHLRDANGNIPQKGEPGYVPRTYAPRKLYIPPRDMIARSGEEAKFMPKEDSTQALASSKGEGMKYEVDPEEKGSDFHAALVKSAEGRDEGKFVTIHDKDYYTDPEKRLFMAPDGSSGVGVDKDGYMFSAFADPGAKNASILKVFGEAAPYGRILDAFDDKGKLPNLYAMYGFRPVARIEFNKEYAPEGWNYDKFGQPDVVIMAKDENAKGGFNYNKVRDSVPVMDYDDAIAAAEKAAPAKNKDISNLDPRQELKFMPNSDPDAVKEAAFRWKDGTIRSGRTHSQINVKGAPGGYDEEGFVTNDGKFLTREEAYQRAINKRQINEKDYQDHAKETGAVSDSKGTLEGFTFQERRADDPSDSPSMQGQSFRQWREDHGLPEINSGEEYQNQRDAWRKEAGFAFMPGKKGDNSPGLQELNFGKKFTREALTQAAVKRRIESAGDKFPEAIKPVYKKEDGKYTLDEDGKPSAEKIDYDLDQTALAKEAAKGLRGPARMEAIKDAYADKLVGEYDRVQDRPDIMAGQDWYALARGKIKDHFGKDALIFAQLLGATSARTPAVENFKQALDAYNQYKAGKYDEMAKKYLELERKLENGEDLRFPKTHPVDTGARKYMIEAGTKVTPLNFKDYLDSLGYLPKRSNDKKFNANSFQVLRVVAGNWAEKVGGPKTPQFASNLSGEASKDVEDPLGATIDVWAARGLHRLGNEGLTDKRWRITPESETGVNDHDFFLGQAAYKQAADRLGINPDALQGVLWFAEKDAWTKRGWTRGTGAELSDFNTLLDKTVSRDGKKVLEQEPDPQQDLGFFMPSGEATQADSWKKKIDSYQSKYPRAGFRSFWSEYGDNDPDAKDFAMRHFGQLGSSKNRDTNPYR